jgi:hypothetical protein
MFLVKAVKSVAASGAGPDRYDCVRPFPTAGRRILAAAAATNLPHASDTFPSSQRFPLSHCIQIIRVYNKFHRINVPVKNTQD